MDEFKTIKCLITAFHVLDEEDLTFGNEIKITFDDDNENIKILKIDGPRYIYASKKEDVSIIEILDSDSLQNYNILEIDESIFYNYIDFYNEYKNKEIYILHFLKVNFQVFRTILLLILIKIIIFIIIVQLIMVHPEHQY